MIIKTKEFVEICNTILFAADNSEISTLKETLELKTTGNVLYLNVTNKEYYARAKFVLDHEEEFHATVNANQFLKLVSKITSSEIELTACDTYLTVKANGSYKLPYIFEDDHLMALPEISIDNPTVTMNVSGDILNSILLFNSKEIAKASVAQPVQKLYYIDQQGCITFTTGATVNNFQLEKPIQVLINNRLVKLFKLFKKDMVSFTLGYDPVGENLVQTKVCFETDNIKLTAVTPSDDSLLAKVPVARIRSLATKNHDNKAVINKESFLQTLNRLALFNANDVVELTCSSEGILIRSGENEETITVENGSVCANPYSLLLNLTSVTNVLESCTEQYVTMGFGDHIAVTITRGSVVTVIPESIKR